MRSFRFFFFFFWRGTYYCASARECARARLLTVFVHVHMLLTSARVAQNRLQTLTPKGGGEYGADQWDQAFARRSQMGGSLVSAASSEVIDTLLGKWEGLPAYNASVPVLVRLEPTLADQNRDFRKDVDWEALEQFPTVMARELAGRPLIVEPNASNATAAGIIAKYLMYGDGSNVTEDQCRQAAAAIPATGLNNAVTILSPIESDHITPLNTYHAFAEALGSLLASAPAAQRQDVSMVLDVLVPALTNITTRDSVMGLHHGYAWQVVTDTAASEGLLPAMVNACPNTTTRIGCWHGAGHGAYLSFSANAGNGPCPVAKTLINDLNGLPRGLRACSDWSSGDRFKAHTCSGGVYHALLDHTNLSRYWNGGQDGGWAFPCTKKDTLFRQNCFHYKYQNPGYKNPGAVQALAYLVFERRGHPSTDCYESGFSEAVTRACIVGLSSYLYNVYDWMSLTTGDTAMERCESHPAYPFVPEPTPMPMICPLLLRDDPNATTLNSSSPSTLVSWCSYFVKPSSTPRHLSPTETLRWYSCVVGAHYHTQDKQEDSQIAYKWGGYEDAPPSDWWARTFENIRMQRFYDCKPLLEVPWQLNHTMRQESFRLCVQLHAAYANIEWLQDESAPYHFLTSPVVPDAVLQTEALVDLAERQLAKAGRG